jgi:hypothetical protein
MGKKCRAVIPILPVISAKGMVDRWQIDSEGTLRRMGGRHPMQRSTWTCRKPKSLYLNNVKSAPNPTRI